MSISWLANVAYSEMESKYAQFPLHMAILTGEPENIETYIDIGIDVNTTNQRGNTPLHTAALKGDATIMNTLLSAGARMDIKNHDDLTPADILAQKTHIWENAFRKGWIKV